MMRGDWTWINAKVVELNMKVLASRYGPWQGDDGDERMSKTDSHYVIGNDGTLGQRSKAYNCKHKSEGIDH